MAQPLILEVAYAVFFILPAWVANAVPVVLGGGRHIDGGRKMADGRPVFGSHKTIRGFAAGIVAGTLTGAVLTVVQQFVVPLGFDPPFQFSVLLGFLISFGALLGDLVHSFVKRRVSLREGAPLPVADQADFVIGALLLSLFVFTPSWTMVAIILVITVPVHLLTNFLAYVFGVKKTPW